MNLDSIFSYGSPVNIIIRAITDTTVGTQSFSANQPILTFKNVDICFSQNVRSPSAVQGVKTLIATQINAANRLTINNISLTNKVLSLLLKYNGTENTISNWQTIEIDSSNNEYYFNETNIDNIFVYEDQTLITNWTYNSDTNVLTFNFDETDTDTHTYLVFYEYLVNSISYLIEYPANPWFKIEIYGQGNNGNSNSRVALILNKCQLTTNYSLSTNYGTNTQTLDFQIIDDKNDKLILY